MKTATRLREMTVRYAAGRAPDGAPLTIGHTVTTAAEAGRTLLTLLADEPSEVFVILCLSTKCRVIAYCEVGRGTLDATLVHPREVFKAALLANAATIVLAHNHPSGDPTPSREDVILTHRLVEAGRVLGVDVADHLVIGEGRWVSFREAGLLR
jgi:DNA repair protein RadC